MANSNIPQSHEAVTEQVKAPLDATSDASAQLPPPTIMIHIESHVRVLHKGMIAYMALQRAIEKAQTTGDEFDQATDEVDATLDPMPTSRAPVIRWPVRDFDNTLMEVEADLSALPLIEQSAVLSPIAELHARQMRTAAEELQALAGMMITALTPISED